jgi:hypothetical protein
VGVAVEAIVWDIFNAWHEWFNERWRREGGEFPGDHTIEIHWLYAEYNGFSEGF